jgi:hypothetical protein
LFRNSRNYVISFFVILHLIFVCSSSYGLGSGSGSGGCRVHAAGVVGGSSGPQAPLVPVRRPKRGSGTCTRTLMPIHDLWVPKYVNWCYVSVCTLIYTFDLRHSSYLSVVLREDLGHVRSRTTRPLMLIHDLWVPKYVWCYVSVCTFFYTLVLTNKFTLFVLGYALQDYYL